MKSDNLFFVHIIVFELFHCGTETLLRRDCDKDNMAVLMKAFSKTSTVHTYTPSRTLESIFKKVPFSVTENALLVWWEGLSGKIKVARV